jgi:hypothetical protein
LLQLVKLVILGFIGVLIAHFGHVQHVISAHWYVTAISCLLGIGLYGSTYGIDLDEARQHVGIIGSAVTGGVLFKVLLAGGSLALLFHDPRYLLYGIIVAQIDPLSVAALMGKSKMSKRAKTILACWSSFDDPVTVILALYAPLLITHLDAVAHVAPGMAQRQSITGYALGIGANLVFAAIVFGLWRLTRTIRWVQYVLLIVALIVGVHFFWMLGIAFIGLFLRPPIERLVGRLTVLVLYLATIMLGLLLDHRISIVNGLLLGITAFCSQMVAALVLTRKLPRRDTVHLMFAQQNGITAIILALLLEPAYPGTVAIIAPAIFCINALHAATNMHPGVSQPLDKDKLALVG